MNHRMKHSFSPPLGLILLTVVWLALGAGCVPAQEHSQYRSIHEYARDGDLPDVQAVLALNRTNLDLGDDLGLTPLDMAALYCHTNVMQYLLEQGANVNSSAKDGTTPLHIAAQAGCVDGVNLLLAKGASLATRDHQGRTPLKRAEAFSQSATADILRQHGGGE